MPSCDNAMKICMDYMPCRKDFSENQYCSCWEYCKEKADEIVAEQELSSAKENAAAATGNGKIKRAAARMGA